MWDVRWQIKAKFKMLVEVFTLNVNELLKSYNYEWQNFEILKMYNKSYRNYIWINKNKSTGWKTYIKFLNLYYITWNNIFSTLNHNTFP